MGVCLCPCFRLVTSVHWCQATACTPQLFGTYYEVKEIPEPLDSLSWRTLGHRGLQPMKVIMSPIALESNAEPIAESAPLLRDAEEAGLNGELQPSFAERITSVVQEPLTPLTKVLLIALLVLLLLSSIFIGLFAGAQHKLNTDPNGGDHEDKPPVTVTATTTSISTSTIIPAPIPEPTNSPVDVRVADIRAPYVSYIHLCNNLGCLSQCKLCCLVRVNTLFA